MSWSAFQREMMAAMDLRPYRLATTPAAAVGNSTDAAADAAADAANRHARTARGTPAQRAQSDAQSDARRVDAPRVDPLIAALLRAAGREIDTPTLLDWANGLRGDADAKRALWPRLRALRRSAG